MSYDPEPRYPIVGGEVRVGYRELAAELARQRPCVVAVDGPAALPWELFTASLADALDAAGLRSRSVDVRQFVAPWKEVQRRTATAELGGIRFSRGASRGRSRCCSMSSAVVPHGGARPNAPARAGSALVDHDLLWYADLPQAAEPRRCQARARGKPWPTAGRGWIGAATAVRRLAGARPPQARSRAPLDGYLDLTDPDSPRSLDGEALRRFVARARRCAVQNSPDVPAGAMGGVSG